MNLTLPHGQRRKSVNWYNADFLLIGEMNLIIEGSVAMEMLSMMRYKFGPNLYSASVYHKEWSDGDYEWVCDSREYQNFDHLISFLENEY